MSTPAKSDKSGQYFQAVVFGGTNTQQAFTGTAARFQLSNGSCSLIEVFATQDCWIKIGNSSVTAAANDGTSKCIRGGINYFIGIPESLIAAGAIYISVVRDVSSGNLDVCEAV